MTVSETARPRPGLRVRRFSANPIIRPGMGGRIGTNINGPSLIRTPEWLPEPLGRYYLYFAHHKGDYIRLAYADDLEGPWQVYSPGTLQLADSFCVHHIASPDVHVDDERGEIRMYYHGCTEEGQRSKVAISTDGISFRAREEILGESYFRVFRWRDHFYSLAMPGVIYRSGDGLSGFEQGPRLATEKMRHAALKLDENRLTVFYSNREDCPERILMASVDLENDWNEWSITNPVTVLEPTEQYEGASLPLVPSRIGWAPEPARQLRDPAIFRENDRTYLLYSVAGEQGIAIAEIILT